MKAQLLLGNDRRHFQKYRQMRSREEQKLEASPFSLCLSCCICCIIALMGRAMLGTCSNVVDLFPALGTPRQGSLIDYWWEFFRIGVLLLSNWNLQLPVNLTTFLRVPRCSSRVIEHIRVGSSLGSFQTDPSVEVCQHLFLLNFPGLNSICEF